MPKVKYYYDTEKLSYQILKQKKSVTFSYILLFIVAAALFGFLSFIALLNTPYFETPKDKIQAREIENFKINYAILNKKMDQIEQVLAAIEERDNNIYRIYFNTAPISDEQRKSGLGGVNRYKQLEGFNNSELVINTNTRLDIIMKQLAIQSKSLDEIIRLASDKEDLLAAIPAIQPVKNEDLKRMASGYGYRSDPFTKIRKFHKGMDFTAKTGTPIFATGDGIIKRADSKATGYGKHIVIKHGFGYETLYAHLSKYNKRPGEKVKRGDIIGYVGSTGRSQASHLHYEVTKDGENINPINFYYGDISAKEFVILSQLADSENQSLD